MTPGPPSSSFRSLAGATACAVACACGVAATEAAPDSPDPDLATEIRWSAVTCPPTLEDPPVLVQYASDGTRALVVTATQTNAHVLAFSGGSVTCAHVAADPGAAMIGWQGNDPVFVGGATGFAPSSGVDFFVIEGASQGAAGVYLTDGPAGFLIDATGAAELPGRFADRTPTGISTLVAHRQTVLGQAGSAVYVLQGGQWARTAVTPPFLPLMRGTLEFDHQGGFWVRRSLDDTSRTPVSVLGEQVRLGPPCSGVVMSLGSATTLLVQQPELSGASTLLPLPAGTNYEPMLLVDGQRVAFVVASQTNGRWSLWSSQTMSVAEARLRAVECGNDPEPVVAD